MLEYRAEGLCRNANHLSREELSRCMASGEVLQSTALAYDTGHRLRFELGGLRGIMPFADCVDAAPGETVKDIAVLTRVGRPTCFVIMGTEFDDNGEEYYLLSRAVMQIRSWRHRAASNRAVVQEKDGQFSVVCSIADMGSDVFRMELAMPDKLTAEMIKNNFIAHGSDIFPKLLNALTQPGSEDDRPPAGLM